MIRVAYTNHRGETAIRKISPMHTYFGSTEHHPKRQWLLDCYDFDKKAYRTYALERCNFDLDRVLALMIEKLEVGDRMDPRDD